MVEDGQSNRCFPNATCTDESDRMEVFGKIDDSFDQLFTPEAGPRRRGR